MALDSIPPWLNIGPQDYLHAIQAGTQSGLEAARMRAAAQEAAARTQLAREEAARNAWQFGETMRQRAQAQAEEDAFRREQLAQTGQYQAGMLDWRNEQMRLAAEKALQQAENQNQLMGLRGENLSLSQARLDETMRANQAIADRFNEMQKLREEAAGMKIDPAQQAILAGEQKRLEALNEQIAALEEGGVSDRTQSGWRFLAGKGEKPEYDNLVAAKTALEQDLQRRFGRGGGIPVSPSGGTLADIQADDALRAQFGKSQSTGEPTVDTQAAYDALAPGTVYRGKDGKRYRKP